MRDYRLFAAMGQEPVAGCISSYVATVRSRAPEPSVMSKSDCLIGGVGAKHSLWELYPLPTAQRRMLRPYATFEFIGAGFGQGPPSLNGGRTHAAQGGMQLQSLLLELPEGKA